MSVQLHLPPQYSCILLFRIFIAVHGPCTMATPTVLGGSVLSLSDSDLGGGVPVCIPGQVEVAQPLDYLGRKTGTNRTIVYNIM